MWLSWVWEGLVSGVMKVLGLWWLVPLFVVIQILKDSGWLSKASRWVAPVLRPLRLPDEAGIPMVAGLAVGLTYGAGVLLQTAEEGKLNRNQLTVMTIFLGICHALIEETILFTAVGASGLLLVTVRVATAALFAWGVARLTLLAPVSGQVEAAKARA